MKRKSIGEVLRDTRELHGWTLEDVQYMTNIPSKFIQALEYNDFDVIPDEAYRRVFLEHYAETLKLDAKVILDAFDSQSMLAYYADAGAELASTSELQSDEDLLTAAFEKVIAQKKQRRRASFLPIFYLILTALTIAIFITYMVLSHTADLNASDGQASFSLVNQASLVARRPLQTGSQDILGTESEPETSTDTSSLVVSSSSSSAISPSTTSQLASTSPSETSPSSSQTPVELTTTGQDNQLQVAVSRPEDKKTEAITLSFKVLEGKESWISVAGTDYAGGILLNDQQPTLEVSLAPEQVSSAITIGYAPDVTFTVNGQAVDLSQLTASPGDLTLNLQ